ncbi:nitric oxide-associated protein 1-like [Ptychodera flava]|uniref:nitric oxide-associated protein 1-like n=1 Tax=Ptychodera flava TaxID=63121 RepID=UPI00396A1A94
MNSTLRIFCMTQILKSIERGSIADEKRMCNTPQTQAGHDHNIADMGEIDSQYFESATTAGDTGYSSFSIDQEEIHNIADIQEGHDNEIDQQYFGAGWSFENVPRASESFKFIHQTIQDHRFVERTMKREHKMFVDTSVGEEAILDQEVDVDVEKEEKAMIGRLQKALQELDGQNQKHSLQNLSKFHETPVSGDEETLHADFNYLSTEAHRVIDLEELPRDVANVLAREFAREHAKVEHDTDLIFGTVDSANLETAVADVLKSLKKKRQPVRKPRIPGSERIFGTPDPSVPSSDMPCAGCGATLHCHDIAKPGYLPSEKFKALDLLELGKTICQRCWLLTHHQVALQVNISAEDFRKTVSYIKKKKALVLCMVDLMDFPCSIFPNLRELIGTNKSVVIIGNKMDLLPRDSPKYMDHIKTKLLQECVEAGLAPLDRIKHVSLISAKSGFGIEDLITNLQKIWKYKGDVYLIGCTNVGKSSLFNQLLRSDYCKTKVSDIIHRATISIWPGTTLNLLKFPILSPTSARMAQRKERLDAENKQEKIRRKKRINKQEKPFNFDSYVSGTVKQTFQTTEEATTELSFDANNNPFQLEVTDPEKPKSESKPVWRSSHMPELPHPNELKQARWFFDTPGVVSENQILTKLTTEELKYVIPSQVLLPQTIRIRPSQVMFLAGLGRLDYIKGDNPIMLTVFASHRLPVHVFEMDQANDIYAKHAGKDLFKVPIGGRERLLTFPALVPKDMTVDGTGWRESAADVVFSSAGWAAVTMAKGKTVELRAYTPGGIGCVLRKPALLPFAVNLRGKKHTNLDKRAFYKIDMKKLMK